MWPFSSKPDIFQAVRNADLTAIKRLVKKEPAALSARDRAKRTALFEAVIEKQESILKFFILEGALVNDSSSDQWTPLHFAAQSGSLVMVKMLLEAGANVNAQDRWGNGPLGVALREVQDGTEKIVKYLVKHGAKVRQKNYSGISAWDVAVDCDNPVVKTWLKN